MASQQRFNSSPDAGNWECAAPNIANVKKKTPFPRGDFSQCVILRRRFLITDWPPSVSRASLCPFFGGAKADASGSLRPRVCRSQRVWLRSDEEKSKRRRLERRSSSSESQHGSSVTEMSGCKSQRSILAMHRTPLTRLLFVHPVCQHNWTSSVFLLLLGKCVQANDSAAGQTLSSPGSCKECHNDCICTEWKLPDQQLKASDWF